jgi:hypothetical protein
MNVMVAGTAPLTSWNPNPGRMCFTGYFPAAILAGASEIVGTPDTAMGRERQWLSRSAGLAKDWGR